MNRDEGVISHAYDPLLTISGKSKPVTPARLLPVKLPAVWMDHHNVSFDKADVSFLTDLVK